jgi:hypothetical protein
MNQYKSLILCLLMASIGQSFSAPVDGTGDCPDGSPNGAQLERGRFFYECRDGNILPKGCLTEDLKHIEIGQTADKKHYRLKCTLASDGLLSFEPVACLFQGSEHKIDEQWEDNANFYVCKKDGRDLRAVTSGCVDQGKRIPLNEKITKDEFVMACNETVNNGARLMPIGCVKDGRQFNVGETFEVDKFWFTCTRVGREKVSVKSSGCVNNGKRLNDGDRFFVNDVIFECNIDSAKNEIRTMGCAQRDEKGEIVERRLGCTWVEGNEPFQYEIACQHDAATNSAKKVPVRCNYKVGSGVYNIDPGCYRVIDKAAFGCLKDGSNLKLQSFQGGNAEQSASGAGLHAC